MRLLGVPEMMLVLLLALLIFGPEKLPNLGRALRNALTESQLTAAQKILATISIIVLAVTLGLLAKEVGR
jgi:TatA/E family protein of Tat protein translocase